MENVQTKNSEVSEEKIINLSEDMNPREHDDASYKKMLQEQEEFRKQMQK